MEHLIFDHLRERPHGLEYNNKINYRLKMYSMINVGFRTGVHYKWVGWNAI